jgi:PhnB protein
MADKIMHASMRIGETRVSLSDGHCAGQPDFKGFGLAMTVKDAAEADKTFAALSEGGKTLMPLAKTFFSPRFGMVADKFGVTWMILVER